MKVALMGSAFDKGSSSDVHAEKIAHNSLRIVLWMTRSGKAPNFAPERVLH
jgi:hypothetical protein